MILNYSDFLTEAMLDSPDSIMTPTLRKSLDDMGKGLDSDEDIVKAIKKAGLEEIKPSPKDRSADYVFRDPESEYNKRYISYKTGYVRAVWNGHGHFTKGAGAMTPISRAHIPDVRDRLLIILRRARKMIFQNNPELYAEWQKSGLEVEEFLEKKRGYIKSKKIRILTWKRT